VIFGETKPTPNALKNATTYNSLELLHVSQMENVMDLVRYSLEEFNKRVVRTGNFLNMYCFIPTSMASVFKPPKFQVSPREAGKTCILIPPSKPHALIRLSDDAINSVAACNDFEAITNLFDSRSVAIPDNINISTSTRKLFGQTIRHLAGIGVQQVVIYYSGHGVNDEISRFPKLVFSEKDKPLTQEKIKLLLEKYAISNFIVIWDCCNEIFRIEEQYGSVDSVAETPPAANIWDFEGGLFVASCSPGQFALAAEQYGGVFSQPLVALLQKTNGNWPTALCTVSDYLSKLAPKGVEMTPVYMPNREFFYNGESWPDLMRKNENKSGTICYEDTLVEHLKNFSTFVIQKKLRAETLDQCLREMPHLITSKNKGTPLA
jgi:hypothetical protein